MQENPRRFFATSFHVNGCVANRTQAAVIAEVCIIELVLLFISPRPEVRLGGIIYT